MGRWADLDIVSEGLQTMEKDKQGLSQGSCIPVVESHYHTLSKNGTTHLM